MFMPFWNQNKDECLFSDAPTSDIQPTLPDLDTPGTFYFNIVIVRLEGRVSSGFEHGHVLRHARHSASVLARSAASTNSLSGKVVPEMT
jgi:hypothetical protein